MKNKKIKKLMTKQVILAIFFVFVLSACSFSNKKTSSKDTSNKEPVGYSIPNPITISIDAQRKKRDTQRQSDLKMLQVAIELYIADNGHAPTRTELNNPADAWNGNVSSLESILFTTLSRDLPKDPSPTPHDWIYCVDDSGSDYLVATTLEQNINISNDLDGSETGWTADECVSSSGGAFGSSQANAINCDDLNRGAIGDKARATAVCLGSYDNE